MTGPSSSGATTGIAGVIGTFKSQLILALLIVVLGVTGWGIHATTERAILEDISSELTIIRDTETTALRIWIDGHFRGAQALAQKPQVIALAEELVQRRSDGRDTAEVQTRLRLLLDGDAAAHGFTGWAMIDANAVLIGARMDAWLEERVPDHCREYVRDVFGGETVITSPFRLKRAGAPGAPAGAAEGEPAMMVGTPVRPLAGGDVLVALAFHVRPQGGFSQILQIARTGETGETYAVDRDGYLISQSRFDDQLRTLGLLTAGPGETSVLNVQARDPGVDLTRGERPERIRADQPLTLAAAAALRGETGFDLSGFRDYRGVPVYGAWAWLPEHRMAVITQVDVAEVVCPIATARIAYYIVFAALVLVSFGAFFTSAFAMLWRGKMRRARRKLEQLGQYTLEGEIGRGGMGSVHRARHALLRRPTAVKLLQPRKDGSTDEIMRFEREVQLTAELSHPNTIAIYDYGRTADGVFYYAMELLEGLTLHDLVQRDGALPSPRVNAILRQVCGSLEEAHAKGLIHRDIKPANIFLSCLAGIPDHVKVLDFGLVKRVQGAAEPDPQMTAQGITVGTPQFLSPEAILAPDRIDARADIYAVGAVGYFLLTGADVFEAETVQQLLAKHLSEPPLPPGERTGAAYPKALTELIMQCLEKDPERRPQSMSEVRERLEACPDAWEWTRAEGRAWWAAHAPVPATDAPAPALPTGSIAVDLGTLDPDIPSLSAVR